MSTTQLRFDKTNFHVGQFQPLPKLSTLQKLELRLTGSTFVFNETPKGWLGQTPIYVVHCLWHGDFLDTHHNFDNRFYCIPCERIWRQQKMRKEYKRNELHEMSAKP